jgi:hypothetical protein
MSFLINLINILEILLKSILNLFDYIIEIQISDIRTFLNKIMFLIKDFFILVLTILKFEIYFLLYLLSMLVDMIVSSFIINWNNRIETLIYDIVTWYEIDFTNFFVNYDNEFINILREKFKIKDNKFYEIIENKKIEHDDYTIELFEENENIIAKKNRKFQLISCIITLSITVMIIAIVNNYN